MTRKSYRGELPKPDPQGRYRPAVGQLKDGRLRRFQVGNVKDTTQAEAQRRLDYIRDLYDRQCAELGIDYWMGWTLHWAMRLAAGPPIKVYPSEHAQANSGQAAEEVNFVRMLQSWGVPIEICDSDFLATGNRFIRKQIEEEVNRAVEGAVLRLGSAWGATTVQQLRNETVPPNMVDAETRTLHEALDARSDHLEATGNRDQEGNLATRARKCRDRLRYLKNHHENIPLWQLTLPVIDKIAAYWRNRPMTARKTRTSWDHAHDMNKEWFRFLEWLDDSPDFRWTMPKGVAKISRSPIKLPEDENQEAFQTAKKETYTPEQLAVLIQHTDALGRAIIGVCVNCAFGASEIGQWNTNRYILRTPHPHADLVGIQSTEADSWIVGPRPKTGVYGEHWIWPEVANAVDPFLKGRPVLPMTDVNTPWYKRHSDNPQTKFGRWWTDLLERVRREQADFPMFPFGALRDLLPNVLRREFSDEVASMCLQHGQIGEDELLKCYANVPFKKLFEATRQLETKFRPFLDAFATPITFKRGRPPKQLQAASKS
jgi:hypothetical protein